MSDIMLWNVTYEVDGEFYTTRPDYDHSWLCDISMDDLVPEIAREDRELKQLREGISYALNNFTFVNEELEAYLKEMMKND